MADAERARERRGRRGRIDGSPFDRYRSDCGWHACNRGGSHVDDESSPEQGEAITTSAGMGVRKAAASTKPPFAAKLGAVSGAVVLVGDWSQPTSLLVK